MRNSRGEPVLYRVLSTNIATLVEPGSTTAYLAKSGTACEAPSAAALGAASA